MRLSAWHKAGTQDTAKAFKDFGRPVRVYSSAKDYYLQQKCGLLMVEII
ncbi:MAG: hypothetical protein HZB42_02390 [Sphingobacteriales bacterium]|nr:hypothetical protein [Sphingobacteriales bacterium]